jgi:hypothetical protein
MDFKLILTWMFGLILVYLLATNSGNVLGIMNSSGRGVIGLTHIYQGRTF